MATLLSKTALPLWVWVVIIVVGSVVVVGTIAFLVRFLVVRRRKADFVDTFGDDNLPQRKVTVRRGRVIEQSKYLSLTGSKFGLNAFGSDDNDSHSRAGARSKSPFEWWSAVKDQSHSRNSPVTQVTNDTSSIYGLPSSPVHNRVYQRPDFNVSSTSLESASEKGDISVSVEKAPASPPPAVRNFSRSFSRQGHRPDWSPRQQTLSRIEESSPHTSMISTRQSRIASYASNLRDTKTSTPSPVSYSPSLSVQTSKPPEKREGGSSKSSSMYHESYESASHMAEPPLHMAYNGSRSTFGDPEARLSQASSRHSMNELTKSRQQSQITALPETRDLEQSDYWDSRPDLHPVRSASKKGRVLRKKSLKQAELVTQIDT